jgi:hypothetical protein
MICTKSLDQKAGDPQTFALAALFSFQGANRSPALQSESTDRAGGAKRQGRCGLARPAAPVRHDGYHIAAKIACQGISQGNFRPPKRPLPTSKTASPSNWLQRPRRDLRQCPLVPGRFPAKGVANAL